MNIDHFLINLMRLEFGFTASFHYIFVPLTLGLIFCIACMESLSMLTRNANWRIAARFTLRFFVLAWLIGIATGYPLRHQLNTNWGDYASYVTPILSQIMAIEGYIGPIMLASVILLALLGDRLWPALRLALSWTLTGAMAIQAATILSMNAWMQHPTGSAFAMHSVQLLALSDVFLNPVAIAKIWHTLSAALVCGATFILMISLVYLYQRRHVTLSRLMLRLALPLGLLATLSTLASGHLSVDYVAQYQPMKFAAFEGLWEQEAGPAGLSLYGVPNMQNQQTRNEIKIPYLMSILTGNGLNGSPLGIREIRQNEAEKIRQALQMTPNDEGFQALQGYRALFTQTKIQLEETIDDASVIALAAQKTVPNVPVLFGSFRIMVSVGMIMLAVFSLPLLLRSRWRNDQGRWLLRGLPWVLPLPWLATMAGWMVAEMGRQPWVIYGYLPTVQAAQIPSLNQGVFGLIFYIVCYLITGMGFVLATRWLVDHGPVASCVPTSVLPHWLRPADALQQQETA